MPLLTPTGSLSYPNLFVARLPMNARPGQRPRFTTVLLFPMEMPDDQKALLVAMKHACLDALKAKYGDKTEALIQSGALKWPFLKKWDDKMGNMKYDQTKWQCFINTWTENQPGIVTRYKGPDGKPMPLVDQTKVYPGALARLSVNPFVYDTSGNQGVAFGLQNVQIMGDGPRLDNRLSAQDTFDAEDQPEADVMSMGATAAPGEIAAGAITPGSALADLFT